MQKLCYMEPHAAIWMCTSQLVRIAWIIIDSDDNDHFNRDVTFIVNCCCCFYTFTYSATGASRKSAKTSRKSKYVRILLIWWWRWIYVNYYRVSQKKLNTFTALNFRSLLHIYANFRNIYGKPDSIAFSNCINYVSRLKNDRDMTNMATLLDRLLSHTHQYVFLEPAVGIKIIIYILKDQNAHVLIYVYSCLYLFWV